MTTAFAHAVRGQWRAALAAQPLGAVLAAMVMLLFAVSMAELALGRAWRINLYRVRPGWVVFVILAALLAAWAYKILAVGDGMG